jgi:hypothetical protein
MSGLRPVAAFFIILTAISWIMVAISVVKTTAPPPDVKSYRSAPDAGTYNGLSTAALDRLITTTLVQVGHPR